MFTIVNYIEDSVVLIFVEDAVVVFVSVYLLQAVIKVNEEIRRTTVTSFNFFIVNIPLF